MTEDEKPKDGETRPALRQDLDAALAAPLGEIDPFALARRDLAKSLPRRFYKAAGAQACAEGFELALDGRPARTPARNRIALPTLAAAQALAAEWERQSEIVDPAQMPLTRIVNSAIDGVAREIEAVAAEIARYGASDLICYRAAGPEALERAEAAAWDVALDFAARELGAELVVARGIAFVEQPEAARAALVEAARAAARPEAGGAFSLAALHVMTTLTGSAVLAFAVERGAMSAADAWTAAHVDEDFEMARWGADDEALAARARRWREMEAAADLIAALRAP